MNIIRTYAKTQILYVNNVPYVYQAVLAWITETIPILKDCGNQITLHVTEIEQWLLVNVSMVIFILLPITVHRMSQRVRFIFASRLYRISDYFW